MLLNRISSQIKFSSKFFSKMPSLANIIENNKRNAEVITSLTTELQVLKKELCSREKQQLRLENEELQRKIDAAKAQLIALEVKNGKQQYSVPGTTTGFPVQMYEREIASKENVAPAANVEQKTKPVKEKKQKKKVAFDDLTEDPIDVGRLDIRVGRIETIIRHDNASNLFIEGIDVGEPKLRLVVSGLVNFVRPEELDLRMVVVLCNLKPAKMRGVTSEAMILCASTPEKVEVLSPPPNAVPGDLVHCEAYDRNPDAQLNPKKKIFETCAPDLKTNDKLIACYKGSPLYIPGKGYIVAQTLKNVPVK